MLMAIAAAVFTWKLYERRSEMRDRGDLLAKTIENTAKTLDENTPDSDQVLKTVTLGDKGAGPLGWIRFHKQDTNSAYKKSLTDFTTAVEKARGQRDTLGGYVAKVGAIFYEKEDALSTAELNDTTKSGKIYDDLAALLGTYYERDKFLTQAMIDNNALVDDTYSVKDIEGMRGSYKEAQAKLKEGIRYFMDQNEIKTETLQKIATTLGSERFGVTPDQITKLEPAAQTTILEKARFINQELDRVVLLDQQIKQLKEEIVQKQAIIDEKDTLISAKTTTIDTLNKQIVNKDNKIKDLAARIYDLTNTGTKEADKNVKYDGRVIRVNYTYNYVVIDVDKDDKLVYGAYLTVARDREYIAKVKITKLYKQYAVAEILPDDKEGEILEGDRVLKIKL
jgi:hypothetical protein